MLDSWHLSSKITLNYGLRWDYYGVIGAENNAFSIFDVKTGSTGNGWRRRRPLVALSQGLAQLCAPLQHCRRSVGQWQAGDQNRRRHLLRWRLAGLLRGQPGLQHQRRAKPGRHSTVSASHSARCLYRSPTDALPIFGDYTPNSVFTVDQNLVTPRYVSYNLNIESQLAKKIAVQIGYVGSQGRHLYHFRDLNQFNNVAGRR